MLAAVTRPQESGTLGGGLQWVLQHFAKNQKSLFLSPFRDGPLVQVPSSAEPGLHRLANELADTTEKTQVVSLNIY